MRSRLGLVVLISAFLVPGCASSRKAAWEMDSGKSGASATGKADPKLMEQGQAAWKKRDDPAQLQVAIAAWEQAEKAGGGTYDIYTALSRAYYLKSDGYTEDVNKKIELFDIGARYGEKALYTLPAFKEVVDAGKPVDEAVTKLDKSAIDAIYWNAVNVGKWAKAKGTGTILFYKSRVKRQIEHVLKLDERYFYGAPHRYLGAYYAAAPGFSGGDIEKSKEHFEKAIAIEPNYFATRNLYAVEYAVKAQNQELYKTQLNFVIQGKPDVLPDVIPEQKIEIEKAKKELPKMDELF